jgi:4-diphosphocytidyl-2C-methyl-D-erythritol kinase
VHIAVEKQIPAQAGMGGGSSDAATCLLALNRLWGLKLKLPALEKLGLQLGADVPFFLRGHNAWVEGVGEKITPIELPAARFWVVKPPQGIDTSQVDYYKMEEIELVGESYLDKVQIKNFIAEKTIAFFVWKTKLDASHYIIP